MFSPITIVTSPVNVDTTLSSASSRISTVGAGVIVSADVAVCGSWLKAKCCGAGGHATLIIMPCKWRFKFDGDTLSPDTHGIELKMLTLLM
jgi:hypothetical protein